MILKYKEFYDGLNYISELNELDYLNETLLICYFYSMIDKKEFIVPEYILDILLKDRTTGKNIMWGTDQYGYDPETNMTVEQVSGNVILPRVFKSLDEQKSRTNDKAEVFTPLEIIKRMNDSVEEDFNGNDIDYINRKVLEITCGEAPYLVSRYDVSTGDIISLDKREGILDRKMRKVNEMGENNWIHHMLSVLESVYGYEWQGDSLLLARINIFKDINDWHMNMFGKNLGDDNINETIVVAEHIISNIIQMDGLNMTVPYTDIPARVMDWENDEMVRFDDKTDESPLF